ncbi:MAG: DoxX family protein [Flavobacteriales bacterium]
MTLTRKLEQFHARARANRWMRAYTVFVRVALAAGFVPSGLTKILGERFTSLSSLHPMGHYLEALYHTGYYYTAIGVLQVAAALLLLIPRTALLGVLIYFPIILNICILSFAVRFEGSLIASPLMVLGCLYLLCWDYHRLKYILPRTAPAPEPVVTGPAPRTGKFPVAFALSAVLVVSIVVLVTTNLYALRPRNTMRDCLTQCAGNNKPEACRTFCACIHTEGQPLDSCLAAFEKAPAEVGAP